MKFGGVWLARVGHVLRELGPGHFLLETPAGVCFQNDLKLDSWLLGKREGVFFEKLTQRS